MRLSSVLCVPLAIGFLLAAQGVAQPSLMPGEGTSGTVLSITLGQDLGGKRPRAWLERPGAKPGKPITLKLKVWPPDGAGVTATVRHDKSLATGDWDVVVKPRGKGAVETRFEDGFRVLAPVLIGADVEQASPKDEVTLTVEQLGLKQGKLSIWGDRVPIKDWDPQSGQVRIKLPAKVVSGPALVSLETPLGANLLPDAFEIVGGQRPGPDQGQGLLVDGKPWMPPTAVFTYSLESNGWTLTILFADVEQTPSRRTLGLQVPLGGIPIDTAISAQAFFGQFQVGIVTSPALKVWDMQVGGSLQVALMPGQGGQLSVQLVGTLHPLLNASQPVVFSGGFQVDPLVFGAFLDVPLASPSKKES